MCGSVLLVLGVAFELIKSNTKIFEYEFGFKLIIRIHIFFTWRAFIFNSLSFCNIR